MNFLDNPYDIMQEVTRAKNHRDREYHTLDPEGKYKSLWKEIQHTIREEVGSCTQSMQRYPLVAPEILVNMFDWQTYHACKTLTRKIKALEQEVK